MAKAIDCSTALTVATATALKADGITFAIRYIDNNPASEKRITKGEAVLICGAGLQIISVFEKMGDRADISAAMGKRDGEYALQAAREVGQPDGSCIYFAVDYDAQASDMDNIAAYIRAAGAATPMYTTGVYGSKAVMDEMQKRSVCSHYWQTYAWSRGEKNPYNHLYQYKNGEQLHGIEVDLDETYGNEGAWSLAVVEASKPINPDPMSAIDANKIIEFLKAAYGATSDDEAQAEFKRLGNELRRVSNQPIQN